MGEAGTGEEIKGLVRRLLLWNYGSFDLRESMKRSR
jgi:hypothetical protein